MVRSGGSGKMCMAVCACEQISASFFLERPIRMWSTKIVCLKTKMSTAKWLDLTGCDTCGAEEKTISRRKDGALLMNKHGDKTSVTTLRSFQIEVVRRKELLECKSEAWHP